MYLSDIGRDGCVAYGAGYRSAPRAIRPDMETRLPRRASAPFPANAPRESASTGRHPVAAAHRRPRLARRAVAALVLPGARHVTRRAFPRPSGHRNQEPYPHTRPDRPRGPALRPCRLTHLLSLLDPVY